MGFPGQALQLQLLQANQSSGSKSQPSSGVLTSKAPVPLFFQNLSERHRFSQRLDQVLSATDCKGKKVPQNKCWLPGWEQEARRAGARTPVPAAPRGGSGSYGILQHRG